jgi:hypothetical protein
MEIKKQFTFSGIFKKIYEIDTKIIKISNANIFCYTNGSVLIEISHEVNHEINHKKFRESAPIYQIEQLTEEQFNDDLVWLSLDID